MKNRIAVILCCKNGEKYILEQLDSLKNQSESRFDLYINDDGSDDNTLEIIKKYKFPIDINVYLSSTEYSSFQKNFLKTLKSVNNNYDYFFFCDQDDIWEKEKIEISLDFLNRDFTVPSLICSRTKIIDEKGKPKGFSPKFDRPPSLRNSLVQSIAGGNTMGFNLQTKILLDQIKDLNNVVSHDWTTYLLVTLYEGEVYYSKKPYVKYRNHSKNRIGSNNGLFSKIERIQKLLRGDFKEWNNKNLNLISEFNLPRDSEKIVQDFIDMRNSNIIQRIRKFFKIGIYRQRWLSNIALLISLVIRKL